MRTLWFVLLVGCASKHGSPPQKDCPKADTDGDFLHVDRDQLAGLCLAAELPRPAWQPDPVALVTADGKRMPWLLVWTASDRPGDEPTLKPADWVAAVRRINERDLSHRDGSAPERKRDGHEWRNILCEGDEAANVVVTAALFDKTGAHAVALRGTKILDEALPADTKEDAVFARAIELTSKLVGQPVTLASHSLAGTPPNELDVAQPWKAALHH